MKVEFLPGPDGAPTPEEAAAIVAALEEAFATAGGPVPGGNGAGSRWRAAARAFDDEDAFDLTRTIRRPRPARA